jgi:hypothetical protein
MFATLYEYMHHLGTSIQVLIRMSSNGVSVGTLDTIYNHAMKSSTHSYIFVLKQCRILALWT